MTQDFVVTGTASYPEHVVVGPRAVFEATLEDIPRPHGHPRVIARIRESRLGEGPISFRIEYPSSADPRHDYIVRASIREPGTPRFTGIRSYSLPANGHGRPVRIMMRPVGTLGTNEGRSAGMDEPERRTHERRSTGRVGSGLTSKRRGLASTDG